MKRMERLYQLNKLSELVKLLDSVKTIKLYGAGYYLGIFLQEIERFDKNYIRKIKCILVSDISQNPASVKGIPVIANKNAVIDKEDCVFLTMGKRYTYEIYHHLENTGAAIIQMDFNMFQEASYREVKESIQPFIDNFHFGCSNLNRPVQLEKTIAWVCWWQGQESMPDIVRACIESQKRNLPDNMEQVIVTEKNYGNYIELPDYILEKVRRGDITLTTLSDIIRASLLYKYGGFWMDATLLVLKPLRNDIMTYPIYTRSLQETQYCTDTMWAGWFMYAKAGNMLFRFLMESFYFYFSTHDKIRHYLMIDYLVAIACNTFPEVRAQLKKIPYNNEGALELAKHLTEEFDKRRFEKYVEETFIQKLTYKLNFNAINRKSYTVYAHLIDEYLKKYREDMK